MKLFEAIELYKNGAELKVTRVMKFKNNILVRGSFYEYHLNDIKLTKKQFDYIDYNFISLIFSKTFDYTIYKIKL
jgi:hypothetical protein